MQTLTEHDIDVDSETVLDDQIVVYRFEDRPARIDVLHDVISTRAHALRMIAALNAALPVLK